MKLLIVGGGSMGKRRVRCLLANGITADQVRIVDPRPDRREESQSKYNVAGFPDLQAGLKWDPTAVLVCIPGERATEVCSTALQAGRHVFCEVPIGMNAAETRRLGELAGRHGVLLAPGAQQPFHPLVQTCRQWVRDPAFGKPLLFNLEWGQYVPGWHPYEALAAFYSPAHLLAVIALETTQFYFITDDRIGRIKCLRQQVSNLQTPGGDVYHMVADTRNGMALTLHFDLIQRPARNLGRFAGEQGTIELDFTTSSVRRYLASTKEWETSRPPEGYSYEQCYIDEIGLLLRCIRGEASWHNPVEQAIDVSRVLDAMRE